MKMTARTAGNPAIMKVSDVLAAFIIRAMMEVASTSETLVNFYETTRRYNPEDSHLHNSINRKEF
jgi:hypothetical protein